MAEHRIELVQLFNAAKQPRHHFFEITRGLCAKTPVFLVIGKNHRLHMRNAVFLEEHMLSAAKANAFSSESTSLDRIAWDISIGTHAQLTKRFSPTHELQQFGIVGLRRQSTELALD